MNQSQLNAIAKKLKLTDQQKRACFLHLVAGDSVYASEVAVYGEPVNTIGRVVKRVKAEFEFAESIITKDDSEKSKREMMNYANDAQIEHCYELLLSGGFSIDPKALVMLQERDQLRKILI